ncbi:E3 ubiquitin-protein ligase SGR9, amyloplastic [Beta vulgaris subsp. vulgaris]|uniref:E3 ubiquitin-protein ligase SGR9, amyloplastic n=1 Tax=Beta vulgaris subsp. vulgaris TaxID=3555 RepID=UPI00203759AA|nr:E3 ubiquitin-protein ligase SGR9, amyloplastic [Beta vulgaris subsp. vulgaris]
MDAQSTPESIIMAALSTLTSSQLSSLSYSLSTAFHRHNNHLTSLLTSPTLFTHTLNHLYSLSLPQKSLLIARHLLSFLRFLTPFFISSPPTLNSNRVRLCDLDSVLLLLFFCEVRQHHPTLLETSPAEWQGILKNYCFNTMLNLSACVVTPFQVLGVFVDLVLKCRRFVTSKGCGIDPGRKEVAASAEAVVALPSVQVSKGCGGVECVICKDEMREGRDVCQLPCQHLFHWMCVLPWLSKRNTCPCCRFLLPTDDVYGEIERLWSAIVKVGLQVSQECC